MILKQRHIVFRILLVLLMPAGLVSCNKDRETQTGRPGEDSFTAVQLALRLGAGAKTKADVEAISEMQENPVFRGVENIHFIPFASSSAVSGTDKTMDTVLALPNIAQNGLVANNNAHLYAGSGLALPLRTSSALVYGEAPRITPGVSIDDKHRDGSLIVTGLGRYVYHASDVAFAPETMLVPGSGTPEEASRIASVLTQVVSGESFTITAHFGADQTREVSVPWNENIGDANLKDCYEQITAGGALIPGSGVIVASLLTNLYRSIYNYNIVNSFQYEVEKDGETFPATKDDATPLTYGDLYRGVRDVILARFAALSTGEAPVLQISDEPNPTVSFVDENLTLYPEKYGLPSGAAVVRWTPVGYIVPLENGLDGIAPISSYCYPPCLYYFANTTLRTSNKQAEEIVAWYRPELSDWNAILENYTDGRSVSSSTSSVALESPLQFAQGLLAATVKASSVNLQDNDGLDYTLVNVSGTKFPLTGIIIGRQYPAQFDFSPVYVSETASKQYYLYDNQMPAGTYLHVPEVGETLQEFRTLSLETPADKEVYFALEFRNDSGSSFYGAEGRILPGHKFYLVGKLGRPSGYTEESFTVFKRDHVTTANCVIKTLKNAHSAVPDMGIPQLTLGVETEINWILATPVTVMCE